MPIGLPALCTLVNPAKTALLLGAGASVRSGAPNGSELATILWRQVAHSEPQSEDLTETATILQRRYSRRAVVDVVIETLRSLKPTGGVLGLPRFGWRVLFTTNFDRVIENAYESCHLPLTVRRSNYDFSIPEVPASITLFKIHGCITQDESLGHKSSMILTEQDYENHAKYRQILFARLNANLLEGDVIVIGQSLRDRHLTDLVREVLKTKEDQGAPGRIFVLAYDKDDLRAPLLEDRGARISFGGIDEFVNAMACAHSAAGASIPFGSLTGLPLSLVSGTVDAAIEATIPPNITRMFNGSPATYADIRVGGTFERASYDETLRRLTEESNSVAIVGAAGIGKTTFGRQLVSKAVEKGLSGWEHKIDFPLQHSPWIKVESDLRASGRMGMPLLDECTHYLRQCNALIDHLARVPSPALRVILTANSAQWAPRLKSPNIFTRGFVMQPSRLIDVEINSLINLVDHNDDISALVHNDFKKLNRNAKSHSLRQKCSADMFVCLKNIFANESLDTILLHEYDDLEVSAREYYRYVAALEAVGTRVHRQLLIRMLGLRPAEVMGTLHGLSGIVEEYDIDPNEGIFGWRTRHLVIARKITDYKFSGIIELGDLFDRIINNINPSIHLEIQSIRDICDSEYGIGRLNDAQMRIKLYRQLVALAPGERIPWHRLIRELLNEGELADTEYVIRDAEEAAGVDSPIDRYKVRLLLVRAEKTLRISNEDRLALVRRAHELALKNVARYGWDKFSYYTLCDVAVQLVGRGENAQILADAIAAAREAGERILDPDMPRRLRRYEDAYLRLR
jgi:hypothetical protein